MKQFPLLCKSYYYFNGRFVQEVLAAHGFVTRGFASRGFFQDFNSSVLAVRICFSRFFSWQNRGCVLFFAFRTFVFFFQFTVHFVFFISNAVKIRLVYEFSTFHGRCLFLLLNSAKIFDSRCLFPH